MDVEGFCRLISVLTASLEHQPLDGALAERLNVEHPPGSPLYESVASACRAAVEAGWMCRQAANGIRYGRVIKPSPITHGFSVDVVEMRDCIGPHHIHPNVEIDLVMPLDGAAAFDGQGAGWKVYAPGSDHFPTVRGGRALVLYLLPAGSIEFTGRPSEVRP
jgi:hypothetical protein